MKNNKLLIVTICIISGIAALIACNNVPANTNTTNFTNQDKIERGRYLAETVASCMHCHSERDFTRFAGPIKEETKGMGGVSYPRFGVLYSSNITPDSATGIGTWTDDEIARAIAYGINREGDTLYPIMPYFEYNKMSKEDIYSIVAYLRTLKPITNKVPERKLNDFASIERNQFQFSAIEDHKTPASDNKLQTGEYLSAIGACRACHTPRLENERFDTTGYFSGGDHMGKKFGFTVASSNISPDKATGIGNWNESTFLEKFHYFRDTSAFKTNPGRFNTLMPWEMLAQIKDDDLKSIYAYLQSLKPIEHSVEKWQP